MGFSSGEKRPGLTLNAAWATGNLWPRSRVWSLDGKLLSGNINDKGVLAELT